MSNYDNQAMQEIMFEELLEDLQVNEGLSNDDAMFKAELVFERYFDERSM